MTAELWLRLPWARSLKDRRQVAQSLVERIGRRAPLAVAEIATGEDPRLLVLGVVAVSGNRRQAEEALRGAIDLVEREGHELEVRELLER